MIEYSKLVLASFLFIVGVGSIMTQVLIGIIIGVALVGVTAPYLTYKWYKLRHGYGRKKDSEIIWQAKAESGLLKEEHNGQK